MSKFETDVLVIGSGLAGLAFAIKSAEKYPNRKITVITKTDKAESNTTYAQGGVAAVWDDQKDTLEKHIADTLDAGDGLCKEDIVRIVVEEGPQRVRELIEWGARFDKEKSGHEYDLAREGGHSEHRILHYKDLTGWEIQRALIEKVKQYPNVDVLEHCYALDLITQHHLGYMIVRVTPNIECYGCYILNKQTGNIDTYLAKQTIICTGGTGQVYKSTTNPIIATGDGIAMAYRAKARVEGMEFVQFHPTALYNPAGENPAFLVSEAVRGHGGILKRKDGSEFMNEYDARGSLAPRDIVARAIDNEMKISGSDCMYLDCRHLEKEDFIAHFPTIYAKCMSIGIDPVVAMIPVQPACHYMCGGIWTDQNGQTSIKNLYAAGESASTGLHGANRLASNSLLEAMVFAHRIFLNIEPDLSHLKYQDGVPEWNTEGTLQPKEMVLITQGIKELKEIMSYYVGIVRSNLRLKRALDRLYLLYRETEDLYQTSTISPQLMELRNLLTIAYLITKSATHRRESRGLHFTTDYPDQLPFIEHNIL
jgi:L-aspartate oxidase